MSGLGGRYPQGKCFFVWSWLLQPPPWTSDVHPTQKDWRYWSSSTLWSYPKSSSLPSDNRLWCRFVMVVARAMWALPLQQPRRKFRSLSLKMCFFVRCVFVDGFLCFTVRLPVPNILSKSNVDFEVLFLFFLGNICVFHYFQPIVVKSSDRTE